MDKTVNLRGKKQEEKGKIPIESEIKLRKTDKAKEVQALNSIPNPITWEFGSHKIENRLVLLLCLAGLFAGGGAAVFFGELTLGMFLILAGVVAVIHSRKGESKIRVFFGVSGMDINNDHYPYKQIKSFWIIYNPGGIKELSLELAKWYMPYMKLPLGSQNPVKLRNFLINFVKEREHEYSLPELFVKRFKI